MKEETIREQYQVEVSSKDYDTKKEYKRRIFLTDGEFADLVKAIIKFDNDLSI